MKRKTFAKLDELAYGTVVKFRYDIYGICKDGIIEIDVSKLRLGRNEKTITVSMVNYMTEDGNFNYSGNVPRGASPRDFDIVAFGYYNLEKYYSECEYREKYGYCSRPELESCFVPLWKRDLKNERFEVSVDEAFSMIAEKLHVPADKIVLAK